MHAPYLCDPSCLPKTSFRSHLLFFGGFIKSASRFQKVNFRSDGEGIQIIERNPTDRIYKDAGILKVVFILLGCWPSRTSTIRSLLFPNKACLQKYKDRSVKLIMDLTISNRILFFLSDIPLN